ncbi:MAG: ATP-binding protein [Planctomycetota bacterium]|nr:ATP-binding protein [Planctomycetota bacterium]
MLRRISTKLVLAVLAAVVLPFVAFAFFINDQIADRLTRDVVRQSLMALAQDLGGQIDRFVVERRQDVEQWAGHAFDPMAINGYWAEEARIQREGPDPERPAWIASSMAAWARDELPITTPLKLDWEFRLLQTVEFDRYIQIEQVYDLILLIAEDGALVTCNSRRADGEPLDEELLAFLFDQDYSEEEWFRRALAGEIHSVDNHESPYRVRTWPETGADGARNYHIGFSAPVADLNDSYVAGVLYTLVNWQHIQDLVSTPVVKEYFRGLVAPGNNPSPYAWIWAADADTILAHLDTSLYQKSITRDVQLPQMVRDVRANEEGWGLYTEYEFRGLGKNAAFKRTEPVETGGFHWVVGIGIDNKDIYATSTDLRNLLLGGTAAVLLMAILWTLVIARRTTQPIRELQSYTRRVAEGDLDARIDIRSRDELGDLARDFNTMTRELKEQQEHLVKVEKDAAWREMARQIAHDIKNPLTPMQLSLDLVARARREKNPGYDEILERTLEMIGRQVVNLREIATDFHEFTGGSKVKLQLVDLGELVDEVLHLHDAWAVEQDVEVRREGPGGRVYADPAKLRRVLGNLVSNSLQAMPEGGSLLVEVAPLDCGDEGSDRVRILVEDTGVGLSDEVRGHLFEPYFTTRSEGTGLGLAIAKRVIEELGGTIEIDSPASNGAGTVATVTLPGPGGRGEPGELGET